MLEEALGRLLTEDAPTAEASRRYRDLRATPFADRCSAQLARIGAIGPVVVAPAGPALSEREHQVALLAGRGLTNREIAAELYLSGKTIEYHLANVFRKFGITGRRQLRGRIHPVAHGD